MPFDQAPKYCLLFYHEQRHFFPHPPLLYHKKRKLSIKISDLSPISQPDLSIISASEKLGRKWTIFEKY